jgi:ketol-acid reductoisomerase
MKRVLDDIQQGRFVQRFINDMKAGGPEMNAARQEQRAHPIEKVGADLRAMMPWIGKNKLVDKSKN